MNASRLRRGKGDRGPRTDNASGMKRIKSWRARGPLATAAALALIATAPSGSTSPALASSAHPGKSGAEAPNRVAAEKVARSLLAWLTLPAGSSYSATQPSGSSPRLSQPSEVPGTPKLIDRPAWWSLPGSPEAVLESIKRRPPAGSRLFEESSDVQLGVGELSRSIEFSWPSVAGVLASRALLLTAVAEPGGTTGLRADAQVVWIVPRAVSERIPAQARVLEIAYSKGGKPPRMLTVQNRSAVRRIAALIDALPIVQPSDPHSCPAMRANPRTVTLTFRAAPTGRPLAEATQSEPPGVCAPMSIEIHGTRRPALTGAETVLSALSKLRPAG
jgi:hypothetical protein